MKYMLLIDNDPACGTPALDAMMGNYFAANERMTADGVLRADLQGIDTATSLRISGGKVQTMDGLFAGTRAHLGDIYVTDVPGLDAALTYAALIPSASFGTIEVRPLMDYDPAG
jgi:hypothetical protein